MAREITDEILRSLKLQDRPSHLELVGAHSGDREVLRITAPVVDGALLLRVEMILDPAWEPSVRTAADVEEGRMITRTHTFCYEASEVDGAAAMVDGFIKRNSFDIQLQLFRARNGRRQEPGLCSWDFPTPPFSETFADLVARLEIVKSCVRSLLTKASISGVQL